MSYPPKADGGTEEEEHLNGGASPLKEEPEIEEIDLIR